MKRKSIIISFVLVVFAIAFNSMSGNSTSASAKLADTYTIDWYTVDGGGATFSTGGSYPLGGTIGQPDARVMSGGSYTLVGGFWGGAASNYNIHLPLMLKNS